MFAISFVFFLLYRNQRVASKTWLNAGFLNAIFGFWIFFLFFGVYQESLFVWYLMCIIEHLPRGRSSFWCVSRMRLSFKRGKNLFVLLVDLELVLLILQMNPKNQIFLRLIDGVGSVLNKFRWFHWLISRKINYK